MVYYVGRDVVVALTSEDVRYGAKVTAAGALATMDMTDGPGATDNLFAGPMSYQNINGKPNGNFNANTTVFSDQEPSDDSGNNWTNELSDVTAVDVGIGTQDEDINFIGQKSTLKLETKKETTLSITRKKTNNCWDKIYNDARYGVEGNGSFHGGLINPARSDYGYRAFIRLKADGQVMTLTNCCIQAHSVSVSVDGVTEETLEFMTYLTPIVTAGTTGTDPVALTTVF